MTEHETKPAAFVFRVVTTFGTYVAAATLSLVNLFIVARELGATGRGSLVFLITVATIVGHLGGFSIQEANANLAVTEPDRRAALATNSVLLSILLGAASSAVVVALVAVFPEVGGDVDRTLLWVALATVPLVMLRLYFHFLAQADYHFGVTNLAWLLGPAATVAGNALLAVFDRLTVSTALAAWIGGQALGIALLVVHIFRHAGFGLPDPALAARSFRFGTKAHLGRTLAAGHYRVDQWFVGAIAGSRELGLYSVATAWAEVLSYLPGVLVLVQRPDLVRATRERAGVLATRICRIALLLTAPLALTMAIAAPFLCVTLLGDDFRGSIGDLRVLTLAAFGVVVLEQLGSALTAQRRPMLTSAALGLALAATIVLNIALVPSLGGLGAAISAAIASTIGAVTIAVIFARVMHTSVRDLVPRPGDVPWLWSQLRTRVIGSARATG